MEERVSIPFDVNEECSLMLHDIEGKEWPPSNNFGDISYDLPDYPNMINNMRWLVRDLFLSLNPFTLFNIVTLDSQSR